TFAINGVGNPRVDAIEAEARCLNGTAYVAVRATNGEDEPVSLRLVTPFGQRAFGQVAPDANAYQSFSTRSASTDAGSVSVVARLAGGGENHTQTYDVAYDAIDCA
ncbi:MAG: peptidase, partial [Cellulosimicrobium sp.]|nr:peptidase [Cellulosimicrobium sp.]